MGNTFKRESEDQVKDATEKETKKVPQGSQKETLSRRKSAPPRLFPFGKSRQKSVKETTVSTPDNEGVVEELTKEKLVSWADPATGFEIMMSSKMGRELFEQFLKKELSSENISFWIASNELKDVKNKNDFKAKVEDIFINFIENASPQEVNLDCQVKKRIMSQRQDPKEKIFQEAESIAYTLMQRDPYPRFLNSRIYKDIMEETEMKENEEKVELKVTMGKSLVGFDEPHYASAPVQDTRFSFLDEDEHYDEFGQRLASENNMLLDRDNILLIPPLRERRETPTSVRLNRIENECLDILKMLN